MARVKNNIITQGLSGKIGDLLIFIQRFGKTFVSKVPARSNTVTPNQEAIRIKFDQAAKYARNCMQDPELKALYAQRAGGGVTPFNLAFADFFTAPVIYNINSDNYTGAVGSSLTVLATDDTKVTAVQVRITAADGSILEGGAAVQVAGSDQWVYTASMANAALAGTKIVALATDLPGNTTTEEKLL